MNFDRLYLMSEKQFRQLPTYVVGKKKTDLTGAHPQSKASISVNQDLHFGRVMPPQAAAIIMYSSRTIRPVSKALSHENRRIISPRQF